MLKKTSNKKTLQTTNVPVEVIDAAELQAQNDGLNSVQDAVRLFLKKYSEGSISFSFSINETLSNQQIDSYNNDLRETLKQVKSGSRKVYKNPNDLFEDLDNE